MKRFPIVSDILTDFFQNHEAFVQSTLVARLNGFVRGFGSLQEIKEEMESWKLDQKEKQVLKKLVNSLKW